MAVTRRASAIAGLVLGVAGGVLFLIGGFVGLAFLAAAGLLIAWKGRWLVGWGSLLVGTGGTWAVLFLRVKLGCAAFDAEPGQACVTPTIDGYLAAAVAMVALGLGLIVADRKRA